MTAVPACPSCAHNFDANFDFTDADGRAVYRCDASHGGSGSLTYQAPPTATSPSNGGSPTAAGNTVATDELLTEDLREVLLGCIRPEDGWTEFGVIEYRLGQQHRDIFARHVRERGHVMFGHRRSTASGSRVSMALRGLARAGLIEHGNRPSTGEGWKQTSPISYWALTPVAADAPTLTWAAFCSELGRPTGWTDEDRAGLTSPLQSLE